MTTKQATISLALALGVFGVAGVYAQQQAAKPAPAAAPSAGGVTVNGVAIPAARIDMILKERAAQGQSNPPEIAQQVREQLINQELLAQAATKKGLNKSAEVQAQIALAQQNILGRAYVQDYLKANPVGDDALKADYEKLKAQLGDKEYKPRHILVEKEDEAKAIIADLGKGGDFAKTAKEKSKDTGSKENGGDLDWGPAGRFVAPFADALKTLPKGQVTKTPVQTNFGYHVILMDDVRDLKAPSFDEVKENLRQRAQQEQFSKMLAELRKSAKIVEQK